uniref:Uncharacterized protein n=1 Tax=Amphimedon queenslandica TaxID=400682 RepID=A0A1X7VX42_AMPQE
MPPLSEEMSEESIAELQILPRRTDSSNNLKEERSASAVVDRFSNLDKLLRMTTYVLKFLCDLWRFKEDNAPLLLAELLWIRKSQSSLHNFKKWKQQLGIFQDEA